MPSPAMRVLPEWRWRHSLPTLNPTLEELADIKTAVSEAVTNAIIHGYENLVRVQQTWGKHSGVQHCSSGKSADALCPGGRYVIHRDHRSGKGNRGS